MCNYLSIAVSLLFKQRESPLLWGGGREVSRSFGDPMGLPGNDTSAQWCGDGERMKRGVGQRCRAHRNTTIQNANDQRAVVKSAVSKKMLCMEFSRKKSVLPKLQVLATFVCSPGSKILWRPKENLFTHPKGNTTTKIHRKGNPSDYTRKIPRKIYDYFEVLG